jgi:glutamate-ammonia-ligase adenylyltransferase
MNDEAASRWRSFCETARTAGLSPPKDSRLAEGYGRAAACSRFVDTTCRRHPELLLSLWDEGQLQRARSQPEKERVGIRNSKRTEAEENGTTPDHRPALEALQQRLRAFRRRELLRIAIRDLAGWACLEETLEDLSRTADIVLCEALETLHPHWVARWGKPVGETSGTAQQMVIVAMGKLGARELNFSSDVDLVFAYPEPGSTDRGQQGITNQDFFARLASGIIRAVGEVTADGAAFRVDMGLRPYGEGGPLVMSFDAMESYYQAQGREWERYAWIKARVAAGDAGAGKRLLERLSPFVYRRYFDYGVFDALREMKRNISREVARKGMAANIKLGAGGIREIEFFGQIFQLIRGGVNPALRLRRIRDVLSILVEEGMIPASARDELDAAYVFLRRSENRIQAWADQQTHDLPKDPDRRLRLAVAMGFGDWTNYHRRLSAHMETVHRHFEGLLEDKEQTRRGPAAVFTEIWQGSLEDKSAFSALADAGFTDPDYALRLLRDLSSDPSLRRLSVTGRARLDRVVPMMIASSGRSEDPGAALARLADLLRSIARRTSYLALLIENPSVIDRLVHFFIASPWVAGFVARHPVLLDELIDNRSQQRQPGKEELIREASHRLEQFAGEDLEVHIEELCVFQQVNTLRVAAADVSGQLPLMKVSDHLSWIAEAVLDQVMALAWSDLTAKHGLPDGVAPQAAPGAGFAVVAYGKLGGLELSYRSDLDLVFLHNARTGEMTGGKKPLDSGQFYARLGQRMIHILTAHTRAGRLYEADMRLRPSGSSGPLVSGLDSFRDYQLGDAWTWENQAIVRARPVGGDPSLALRFETVRKEVLARRRNPRELRREVAVMREKLRAENQGTPPGMFDLKQDPGGIVDIEFLVQYLVLRYAHAHPELTRWPDNVRLLVALIQTGVMDNRTSHLVKHIYLVYRAYVHRMGLQQKDPVVPAGAFAAYRNVVRSIWRRIMEES